MANHDAFNIAENNKPLIVTTQPDHILRHSISDEELDMLCDSRTDMVLEILLIAVGAILGTLPAACAAMLSYFNASTDNPSVIGFTDFVQILIFWASLVLAIGVGIIFNKKSKRSVSLREQIRSRTNKQMEGNTGENTA